MNRWRWAALMTFVVGLAVSFLLVPYGSGACPTTWFGYEPRCDGAGPGLRIMAVLLTMLVSFILLIVGALANPKERKA